MISLNTLLLLIVISLTTSCGSSLVTPSDLKQESEAIICQSTDWLVHFSGKYWPAVYGDDQPPTYEFHYMEGDQVKDTGHISFTSPTEGTVWSDRSNQNVGLLTLNADRKSGSYQAYSFMIYPVKIVCDKEFVTKSLMTPTEVNRPEREELPFFLSLHNNLRTLHQVADLEWSESLAVSAQNWANGCSKSHELNSPYGENLYWSSGHSGAKDAMNFWYAERSNYEERSQYYKSEVGFSSVDAHFTQIIWKGSRKLGCATTYCAADKSHFSVCRYDPHGNINGAFVANVLPPKALLLPVGSSCMSNHDCTEGSYCQFPYVERFDNDRNVNCGRDGKPGTCQLKPQSCPNVGIGHAFRGCDGVSSSTSICNLAARGQSPAFEYPL